jgi:dTDP-4-dehydrorhamnose 3,5-epimerase-like enzyme
VKYFKCEFQIIGDERGSLVSLEANKNIPFDIKRIYYIFDTKQGVRRGFHAHKKLEQILICTSGSCDILLDDGEDKNIVRLNSKNEGLYISNNIWREMFNFSQDCVLMVLASEHYDESDYIRNYDDFLLFVNGNKGK